MNQDGINLSVAVRVVREVQCLSIRALAERANVSASTISAIENRLRGMSVKTAQKIAGALGINFETLIILAKKLESEIIPLLRLEKKMEEIALEALGKK